MSLGVYAEREEISKRLSQVTLLLKTHPSQVAVAIVVALSSTVVAAESSLLLQGVLRQSLTQTSISQGTQTSVESSSQNRVRSSRGKKGRKPSKVRSGRKVKSQKPVVAYEPPPLLVQWDRLARASLSPQLNGLRLGIGGGLRQTNFYSVKIYAAEVYYGFGLFGEGPASSLSTERNFTTSSLADLGAMLRFSYRSFLKFHGAARLGNLTMELTDDDSRTITFERVYFEPEGGVGYEYKNDRFPGWIADASLTLSFNVPLTGNLTGQATVNDAAALESWSNETWLNFGFALTIVRLL